MKKTIRILALVLALCLLGALFAGCGRDGSSRRNKKDPARDYIGKWSAYKISTDGEDLVFADYAQIVKMELTVEFKKDGTYISHYYVNGEEGDKYPQTGEYSMDGDTLVLDGDGATGEIIDGELVLSMEGGRLKHYYRPVD